MRSKRNKRQRRSNEKQRQQQALTPTRLIQIGENEWYPEILTGWADPVPEWVRLQAERYAQQRRA